MLHTHELSVKNIIGSCGNTVGLVASESSQEVRFEADLTTYTLKSSPGRIWPPGRSCPKRA